MMTLLSASLPPNLQPLFPTRTITPRDHFSVLGSSGRKKRGTRTTFCSTASAMEEAEAQGNWVQFPKLPHAQRAFMESLISTIDARLDSQLNPCLTSPDVRFFQNEDGTSQGSVNIRSGIGSSKIRYILASWLHCELPFGVLDITTIMGMLNTKTDAPHFLVELIQNGPTSILLLLDLLPRKDLVRHPDYLKKFYEDTKLDLQRQEVEKLPVVQPYVSPFLSIRSVPSPTAILSKINFESQLIDDKAFSIEELIDGPIGNSGKEVLNIWLEQCAGSEETEMREDEKDDLQKRDDIMRSISIEIDLRDNLPRLFNSDVANQVLAAIEKGV